MARHHSDDWFICPNCGEQVAMKAKSCPSCGADDETAWAEDAFHAQGLNLPDEDDAYDQNQKIRRNRGPEKKRNQWIFAALIIAVLAAFVAGILMR